MKEIRYMISDASKQLEVEPHVLRYWEDELEMKIKRNEMGHRYYYSEDISVLKHVRDLKNKGFQLKAIKLILPELENEKEYDLNKIVNLKDELNRRAELNDISKSIKEMKEHGTEEMKENNTEERASRPFNTITGNAINIPEASLQTRKKEENKEVAVENSKILQFQNVMDRIIANAVRENNENLEKAISERVSEKVIKEIDYILRMQEELDEERYKKLDETMRDILKSRQEAAVTENTKKKKRLSCLWKTNVL